MNLINVILLLKKTVIILSLCRKKELNVGTWAAALLFKLGVLITGLVTLVAINYMLKCGFIINCNKPVFFSMNSFESFLNKIFRLHNTISNLRQDGFFTRCCQHL